MLLTAHQPTGQTFRAESSDIDLLSSIADLMEANGWQNVRLRAEVLERDIYALGLESALRRIVEWPQCDAQGIAAVALGIPIGATH